MIDFNQQTNRPPGREKSAPRATPGLRGQTEKKLKDTLDLPLLRQPCKRISPVHISKVLPPMMRRMMLAALSTGNCNEEVLAFIWRQLTKRRGQGHDEHQKPQKRRLI